jgi:hypothetical protein
MNTSNQQTDTSLIVSELKQKLKTDGQLLATNPNQELCGRLTYIEENGTFLYSSYLGNNLFEDGNEISLEEASHILQFESELQIQQRFNKIQKKQAASEFLNSNT